MEVVLDGVKSKFPELVAHQDCHAVEESLEAVQRNQVSLVPLIKNVLNFREPPNVKKY